MAGNLTKDAAAIEASQRALPIGYWKGSGLSLVLDMLAAMLSGGLATHQIPLDPTRESGISQIFLAIDPGSVADSQELSQIADGILNSLREATPVDPGKPVRYPGEQTLQLREENLRLGVPVDPEIWTADQRASLADGNFLEGKMRQAADNPLPVVACFEWFGLEVETYLSRHSARCDVVRAAEGGEEVVQRVLVGDVHGRQAQAPLVLVAVEEIVLADRRIEEAALLNARRILVVVLGARGGNRNQLRGQLRSEALISRYPDERSCLDAVAGEARLELLIRRQPLRSIPGWPLIVIDGPPLIGIAQSCSDRSRCSKAQSQQSDRCHTAS